MSAAGMTAQQQNAFGALEDHMVALLQAEFGSDKPAVRVLTRSDLEGVKESAQPAPAIHVISTGFRPIEAGYKIARLQHGFYVVAVARSAATQRSRYAARQAAGKLVVRAIDALIGENLPGASDPLELAASPAGWGANALYYMPTGWQVETIFRKTKNPQ